MPILNWLDREKDIKATENVPYRLLKVDTKLSYGDPESENMLIQGDNLEALKALLPYYAGKIKCIFIDPPYNTRSAFEHYDDNLEHTKWLSMMYPRLELLRELLHEEGSIWATIEDREGHYLKVIMDEVFGRNNFIQTIVWNRKVSPANDARFFSNDHDYLYVYAKNIDRLNLSRLDRSEKHNKHYTNPDNDPKGRWNSLTFTGNKNRDERPNLYYSITNPHTGDEIWPPKNLTWRYSKERAETMLENGEFYFGKDKKSKSPRVKQYLSDAKPVVPRSVWGHEEAGHTQQSMLEIKALFENPFGTPKPEKLLQRIISIASKKGDLILDSFLGSATTSAVAQKMGRKYIGIELGDHAISHCRPRLKKVIDGEEGGISKDVDWNGGGGFKFYHLGEAVFDSEGQINPNIKFEHLAAHIWFSETKYALSKKAKSPLLGIHNGTAYYLLYNGILGDKTLHGGNVLTSKLLDNLPAHDGAKIIYGESSRLGAVRLAKENILFKQTPYDVKAR